MAAVGSAQALKVSYLDKSTSSGSANITLPSTISSTPNKNLILLLEFSRSIGATPSQVLPSGFTNIYTFQGLGENRFSASYKISNGTEQSQVLTGMDGDNRDIKMAVVLKADKGLIGSASAALDTAGEITNVDPTSKSLTVTGAGPVIAVCWFGTTGTPGSSATFSPSQDGILAGATDINDKMDVYYKIMNTAPANINTLDMNDEGTRNTIAAFAIRVLAA